MNPTCRFCGSPLGPTASPRPDESSCPSCGKADCQEEERPGADPIAQESERDLWLQKRRRTVAMLAVVILLLLVSLIGLLMKPLEPASWANTVRNAVFGKRMAEAASQALGSGRSESGAEGQGGRAGSPPSNGMDQGRGPNGEGTEGGQAGGGARSGADGRRPGGLSNPGSDPQVPPQASTGNPPEERSIGDLGNFAGLPQTTGPIRPGEGGTGTNLTGVGGTNTTARLGTNQQGQARVPPPSPQGSPTAGPPRPGTNRTQGAVALLKDDTEQRLDERGAGSGDIRVSLIWNNLNDLDLHVVDPDGETIYFSHTTSSSGGRLDIDTNSGRAPLTRRAVENIYWPVRAAPPGTYQVLVHHFALYDTFNETDYTVRILVRGRTTDFQGRIRAGVKKQVHQFTLQAAGR